MDTQILIQLYKFGELRLWTADDIVEKFSLEISISYARSVITFVRNLQDACFFGLPQTLQDTIVGIEDGHLYNETNASIAESLNVHPNVVRFARLYMEMEDAGAFDKIEAYQL